MLGKLIGVYLGRPIEGWTHQRIKETHGEVDHFLPGRDGAPLVVTDDDVTGTFTFLRALADNEYYSGIDPQHIANTWLNYTIERRTIFWWGGLGNSSEHTAYLRLKAGTAAPQSGSRALNGKVISEQIGAQIFIDGWGMVAPGDPERAADFARRAASVSHDGEAIYGAQVVAAMEALAFIETNLTVLLDTAATLIPTDSVISRVIHDVRNWHAAESDWRKTRHHIADRYGYDTFVGPCHIVPNHALIILALLYGEDDFRRSLMIVNTSGWDTDCNSGNVGCLLGIKNGIETFDGAFDWRGPIGDRLYLPTADGGRAITDAVTETYHVVNTGRKLAGVGRIEPKSGARFHFDLPGSVQGFQVDGGGNAQIVNIEGHSRTGSRSLQIEANSTLDNPVLVWTPTFIPPEAITMPGYELLASPTLYSGQILRMRLEANERNAAGFAIAPAIRFYDGEDQLQIVSGPVSTIAPGIDQEIEWVVPDTAGLPIFGVGLLLGGKGIVHLDWLRWDGEVAITLGRPNGDGTLWRRAWVNGVDQFEGIWPEPYRIVQNQGTGLISQGTAEWRDYRVSASVTINLAKSAGIAARVQGMRRYYALILCDDQMGRLVRVTRCDNSSSRGSVGMGDIRAA